MSGWIKLHRKVVDWEWYTDIPCKVLFFHLLVVANRNPSRWKGIDIDIGQRLTGRVALAKETGLSEQEIRTALIKLKSTGELTIKSTNKFSLITICNYKDYQCFEDADQPAEQPAGQPTSNQQSTTNKKVKNLRRREEKNIRNENSLNLDEIPKSIDRKVITAFIEHRKAIKKPLTQYALSLTCKDAMMCHELYGLNPNEVIETVISNGWQGCNPKYFEPRPNGKGNGRTPRQQYMEDVSNLLENIDEATNNGHPTRLGQAAPPLPRVGPQPQVAGKPGV